ncbi:MAG: hypothetical protein KGL39_55085 [Patescibacteria group bacterium]|nr:hypothetical protein [Patescibacteria group bacterium]
MTYDTKFEHEFHKLVEERIKHLTEIVLNRNANTSFGDYHFHVGQVDALMNIIPEICEETNRKLAER